MSGFTTHPKYLTTDPTPHGYLNALSYYVNPMAYTHFKYNTFFHDTSLPSSSLFNTFQEISPQIFPFYLNLKSSKNYFSNNVKSFIIHSKVINVKYNLKSILLLFGLTIPTLSTISSSFPPNFHDIHIYIYICDSLLLSTPHVWSRPKINTYIIYNLKYPFEGFQVPTQSLL